MDYIRNKKGGNLGHPPIPFVHYIGSKRCRGFD
jgi:hypothetical protein